MAVEGAKRELISWLDSDENSYFEFRSADVAQSMISLLLSSEYPMKIKVPTTYPKSGALVVSSTSEELEDLVKDLNNAKIGSIKSLMNKATKLFDAMATEEAQEEGDAEMEEQDAQEEAQEEADAEEEERGGGGRALDNDEMQVEGKKKGAASAAVATVSSGGDDYEIMRDEDDEDEGRDDELENEYYEAKALKKAKPAEAFRRFDKVVTMDTEKGDWALKALKQSIKLSFATKNFNEMKKRYAKLLDRLSSSNVSRNDSKKAINTVLNLFSFSSPPPLSSPTQNSPGISGGEIAMMEEFYKMTLDKLLETKNEQLWFSTQLKLGQLHFDLRDFSRLSRSVVDLKSQIGTDPSKGGLLLEVYALEIQMYTETGDKKKLKELYERSSSLIENALVPNPRITGIIRECGGKMNMREGSWTQAHQDFFDAFKSYDEAGNPRRINCLRYLVLANMLMSSKINPFAANEAKPYENHPEILAMKSLVEAYQRRDITEFDKILRDNRDSILGDSFIRNYIDELLRNIRTQVLLQIMRPYTRIHLPYVAHELNISVDEVESLCVDLILDGRIDGQLDQISQLLQLNTSKSNQTNRYTAIHRWVSKLQDTHSAVINKVST